MRLEPGQSVQHAASWENGSIPNWFFYPGASFSGPGTYDIALNLRIADEEQVLGSVRTPAVTLRRIEPIGIDGELWKRMREVSGGRWTDGWFKTKKGEPLAKEILRIHPASSYYPYVLALRGFGSPLPDKDDIPALLEAAERFSSSPAYPYLLSAAAHSAWYAGWVAADKENVVEAKKYLGLAEVKYRQAMATKTSVAVRASSELGLRRVTQGMKDLTERQRR